MAIDMNDPWQRVPGNAMLKRAMEVSLVGDHSLCIVTDEDPLVKGMADISDLCGFDNWFVFKVPDFYSNGVIDWSVTSLGSEFLGWEMLCQTSPVSNYEKENPQGERLESILNRVKAARLREKLDLPKWSNFDSENPLMSDYDCFLDTMLPESITLFNAAFQMAKQKHLWTGDLFDNTLSVADSVRRSSRSYYDGEWKTSNKIDIHHIAEAIQYQINSWTLNAAAHLHEREESLKK